MQTLSQANPIETCPARRFYTSKQQLHFIKLKKRASPRYNTDFNFNKIGIDKKKSLHLQALFNPINTIRICDAHQPNRQCFGFSLYQYRLSTNRLKP